MSDDLVKRLRTSAGIDDVHDAADLIEAQAAEIARLRARVAELEAVIDPGVLQAAKPFPVEEAIRKVVERSLLTDQQKIEVYLAYKYRWIKAFFTVGRQRGMEEAAKRLEELHKNHGYDPQTGGVINKLGRYDKWPASAKTAKLEHDAGYYRAISEGVAHIRAAA